MKRYMTVILCALPNFLLCISAGGQASDKVAAFKSFLPEDAYLELTTRSIKTIEEAAKGGAANAASKIETEAMILAGYALSGKVRAVATASTLEAAFKAAEAAQKNDIKRLASFSTLAAKTAATTKFGKVKAHDLDELMYVFRGKAKGGEGIHADLQYQPKLKNLNGIEALIGALATKKLSEANLEKVSKELVLLSYRVAVIGVVTHETAPDKDAKQWRDLANQMRDGSILVAESARKKDGDGIMKGALALETSCTACHMAFKKK